MWTFDKIISLAALWSASSMVQASDELVLRGASKDKLSGTVTGIEESGVIVLASPLSNEPLHLKPNTVERVVFGDEKEPIPGTKMLVELTNGDRLPIEVKTFTSKAGMRIISPAIGDVVIPSSALSTLELGIPERKLAFSGPGNAGDWSNPRNSGFDKVTAEAKDWAINGRLEASRQIDMPKNFVLSFQLEWAQRQQPNIKIYFASPALDTVTKSDRYFLQFGSAGFEIKREKTKGSGFPSILISGRRPEEFTDRQVDIEIHVNRVTKRIDLFLDGQLEAWGLDPLEQAPDGSGLILTTNGMEGTTQSIRNLTVHELDNTRIRHRAEDRGSPDKDSLISRDEDRWAGELREIRPNGDDMDFIFQTSLRDEPLEIPLDDVSTVFFRLPSDKAKEESMKYQLQLRGEGMLSVKSCRISDNTITVTHPLLGELTLPKNAISRIEPTNNPDNKGDESE